MFVRTLLVGLISVLAWPLSAKAQLFPARLLDQTPIAHTLVPIIAQPVGGFVSSRTPTLADLARQPSPHYESPYQSCEAHRRMNQQWTAQRNTAAKPISVKQWTDEERAEAKFQGAHALWRAGNTAAARRWLEVVLRDYASTPTAERARQTLAKL